MTKLYFNWRNSLTIISLRLVIFSIISSYSLGVYAQQQIPCVVKNGETPVFPIKKKTSLKTAAATPATLSIPPAGDPVYKLQSFPGVPYVLYLDFDGMYVANTSWNSTSGPFYCPPTDVSASDITTIWKMVSEDFSPYNLNITTDSTVFWAAPAGQRQRLVLTTEAFFGGNPGGISQWGSFTWTTQDCPNFVSDDAIRFNGPKKAANTISHELGHCLKLDHDGTNAGGNGSYYSGAYPWAPIMGHGDVMPIVQFSKGEYQDANNTQDDLAIIATNGFTYRTDEAGNTNGTAKALAVSTNGIVASTNNGIITKRNDIDVYSFTTSGGTVNLTVNVDATSPNLDVLLTLQNSSGTTVTTANPTTTMGASISTTLTAGTYYLQIDGTGKGDPLNAGYSDYGSIGQYSITGTVPVTAPAGSPVVSITSPANGASVPDPATISITASASDPNGTISKVEFYYGTTLIGTTTAAPYTVSWIAPGIGTYALTAWAYDNSGLVTTSSAVNVTVIMGCASAALPLTENFTSYTFPSSGWYVKNPDNSFTWERADTEPSQGFAAKVNNFDYWGAGQSDDLLLPKVDFSGASSATLTFKVSYSVFVGTADTLKVFVTPNCDGTGGTQVYKKWGTTLATHTATGRTVPASSADWRTETVDLSAFVGQQVKVYFRNNGKHGDQLYIDDINISAVTGTTTTPTVTFNNASATYGNAPISMIATSNSTGAMTYSITSGSSFASINSTTGQVTILGAGTVTVQVSQAAAGTYSAATKTATLTISKAALTAKADDKSRVYGSSNPTFTITYTGFVNGETVTAITAPTASTTATASSNVGTYAITLTGGTAANYTITNQNGTLTVTKAALTATADDKSRVYGTSNPSFTITYTGFVNGETVSAITAPTASTTATASSNVGTYSIDLTGGSAVNYTITLVSGTLTVTKATPTLTYTGPTSGTVGSIITLAATTTGTTTATFSVANGTGTATLSGSSLTLNTVGTVTVTVSVAASPNYKATSITQTITITNLTVPSITFGNIIKVYGDIPFNMTATSNSSGAMTYSITSGSSFASINSSTGQVTILGAGTVTVQVSQAANGSYAAATQTATLTINKATLTAKSDDKSRVYGASNPTFTITYTGFVNGETVSAITAPTASTSATASSNVGTYAITLTGGSAANYTITNQNGTLTVTKAALTAKADDKSRVYGTSNPTFTITYTGFVNGETVSAITAPTASTSATASSNAGTYAITLTGGSATNYTITNQNGALTVTKATLTAKADDKSRVYGASNPAFTITYTGFVNGETVSAITAPTASTSATATSNAGTYSIDLTGGSAANYTISLASGTLTVTQAALSGFAITSPNSGTIGSTINLTSTSPSSGAITWSIISGTGATLSGNVLTLNSAGTITIQAIQAASGNYSGGTITQTVTINNLTNPTLTFVNSNLIATYGDAPIIVNATSNSSGAITYSITSGSSFASINPTTGQVTILGAGTVTIQVSQAVSGSYAAATQTAILTINKATPVITYTGITSGSVGSTITVSAATNSDAIPTYALTNGTGTAILSGPGLVLNTAGNVAINVFVAATANFNAASIDQVIVINSLPDPTVTINFITSGIVGEVIPLSITTNSAGTITYNVTGGTGAATVNGNQLTLTSPGTVTLTVSIASDGSYGATSVTQIVNVSALTSVSNSLENGMRVYPSVTDNSTTIEIKNLNLGNGLITITDMNGIEKSAINYLGESEIKLEVSSWTAGAYVIKLQTENGVRIAKLIKQ